MNLDKIFPRDGLDLDNLRPQPRPAASIAADNAAMTRKRKNAVDRVNSASRAIDSTRPNPNAALELRATTTLGAAEPNNTVKFTKPIEDLRASTSKGAKAPFVMKPQTVAGAIEGIATQRKNGSETLRNPPQQWDAAAAQARENFKNGNGGAYTNISPKGPSVAAPETVKTSPSASPYRETMNRVGGELKNAWRQATGQNTGGALGPKLRYEGVKGAAINAVQGNTKWAGRAAAPLGVAMEAKDVYDVATDKNSTKLDVATQVGEGAGKMATAGLGAAVGSSWGLTGGAALGSLGGPVGTAIGGGLGYVGGGIIGGGLGYLGGEKLINTLRGEESPAARLKTVDMPVVEATRLPNPLRDPETERVNANNAATLAKANAENPDLAGGMVRPKVGDSVPIDENTVRVFDGQAWVNRTSEAGKQRQALRDQQYQDRVQRDYENATRDGGVFMRQLRNFDEMKQRDYVNGLREQASWGKQGAAKKFADIMSKQAVIDDARATRAESERANRNTLRSQEIAQQRLDLTAERDRRNEEFKTLSEANRVAAEQRTHDLRAANEAEDRSRNVFSGVFDTVDDDGKPVANKRMEAIALEYANRSSGGKWGTLSHAERAERMPDAIAYAKLVQAAEGMQNQGAWQKYGLGTEDALWGGLPDKETLRDSALSKVTGFEGATTRHLQHNDYKLRLPDGREMHFPANTPQPYLQFLFDQGVRKPE